MIISVFVWDGEGSPPDNDCITVLWNGSGNIASPDTISVPQLVEEHADVLKARYLAWIYEVGETRILEHRLVDHLELRPGFSYWWMTLIAEKSIWASLPQITDAMRMLAFDKWACGRDLGLLTLASSNSRLADCLRSWCDDRGIAFEWLLMEGEVAGQSWLKRLYHTLPHSLQALIWLTRHLIRRWPLRCVGLQKWCQTECSMTFISYLFNLIPEALQEERFESRFWADLPDVLNREGCNSNWLHLYVKDGLSPTAGKAADAIRKLNKTGRRSQTHTTLDAFLGARVVFRTLRDWFLLGRIGRRLQQTVSSLGTAEIDLWPLFQEDWNSSMSGQVGMSQILIFNLLESAIESLPRQRTGVYLQENQPWELALIYIWKAQGHGRLIGVPHSTILYWDLRYFFDPRSYERIGGNNLPLPDLVALNGPVALDTYLKGGYPERDMVEVEALRYLYLVEASAEPSSVLPKTSGVLRVLVLGDYVLNNTLQQMRLMEKAAQYLPKGTTIMVKPHPACPIRSADFPALPMEMTLQPVSKLFSGCDVAYTGITTSAAVDAYCAGVPVVSMLSPNSLNLSPLRGHSGIFFAGTPEELARALISAASVPRPKFWRQDFFTLDSDLPRWRKLLLEPAS